MKPTVCAALLFAMAVSSGALARDEAMQADENAGVSLGWIGGVGGALALSLGASGGGSGDKNAAPSDKDQAQEAADQILIDFANNPPSSHLLNALSKPVVITPKDKAEFARRSDVIGNRLLSNTGAAERILMGYSGKGVRLGLADDGLDLAQSTMQGMTLAGQYNPLELDYSKATDTRHANIMAQVIAAPTGDGNRVRGIAPNVSLYDIQALGNAANGNQHLSFFGPSANSGMKYVADQKLDIVNGSFFYRGVSDAQFMQENMVEGHMARAIGNGTIFVFANGNQGLKSSTSIPVLLGGDEAFKGQVIAVAALGANGKSLANYSNACGSAMSHCLLAPGEFSYYSNSGALQMASGTSVSTATVSGILALLKEQFPELTPSELVQLVFLTADDLGDKGVDPIFGQGAINVSRAVTPVGELKIATSQNASQTTDLASGIALADQIMAQTIKTALSGREMVLLDDFARGYAISLPDMVIDHDKKGRSPLAANSLRLSGSDYRVTLFDDGTGAVTTTEGLSVGYGMAEESPEVFGALVNGYDARDWLDDSYSLTWKGDALRIGAALAPSGRHKAVWLGIKNDLGLWQSDYTLGLMQQENDFAGSYFGSGQSESYFLNAIFETKVDSSWDLALGLNLAQVGYRAGAWIAKGKMTLASLRLSARYHHSADHSTAVTIGSPLSTKAGYLDLDLASSRSPHDSDLAQVIRSQERVRFGAANPVDLGAEHHFRLSEHLDLRLQAALRKMAGASERFAAMHLNLRF